MLNSVSRDIFFRLCDRIQVGSIQLTTPDGKTRVFEGARTPEIRAELEIEDPSLFADLLTQGDWGLGWGYVQGKWRSKRIDQISRVFMLNEPVFRPAVRWGMLGSPSMRRVLRINRQNQAIQEEVRRRTVGECYDVGNDFFRWMLGPSMVFTSAIWPRPEATLDEAQAHKLELVSDKARIESGQRVIDLGCGWGTLADTIRLRTGARVKGIALSRNQIAWAKEHHPETEYEYLDYARVTGSWDRIVSVGLAEHVGRPNFGRFLRQVSDLLLPEGRFVMHTMVSHDGLLMQSDEDRWVSFGSVVMPNGDVPSMADIVRATLATGDLRIVHTETFGIHYARTSQAWVDNLRAHHDEIVAAYSEELFRTYEYAISMGGVAMETGMDLVHVVFEKRRYGSDYTDAIL